MKIATLLLAILSLSFAVAVPAEAQDKKTPVACFSHTQPTEKVALEIHKRAGGDIFQIETAQARPNDHQATRATADKKSTDEEYGLVNPDEMPLKMQKVALIAAFTASGDIDRLKPILAEGLEAGLTVNQIKEVLIHVSAYAGFPRALNGINAFITVMDEREKQGIKDVHGPEASPVPTEKTKYEYGHDTLARLRDPSFVPGPPGSLQLPAAGLPGGPRYESFTPTIEVFLKEQLFADIFLRDVLDYASREVATVGVISNLPGANAQLRSHIGLTMTQGFNEQQMRHLFTVMGTYLGRERGDNALMVLQQAVDAQKK